jgi:hypothetical protein
MIYNTHFLYVYIFSLSLSPRARARACVCVHFENKPMVLKVFELFCAQEGRGEWEMEKKITIGVLQKCYTRFYQNSVHNADLYGEIHHWSSSNFLLVKHNWKLCDRNFWWVFYIIGKSVAILLNLWFPCFGLARSSLVVTICTASCHIQKFYVLPTEFYYVLYMDIWRVISLYSIKIKWLILITERECVYSAVRFQCVNMAEVYLHPDHNTDLKKLHGAAILMLLVAFCRPRNSSYFNGTKSRL